MHRLFLRRNSVHSSTRLLLCRPISSHNDPPLTDPSLFLWASSAVAVSSSVFLVSWNVPADTRCDSVAVTQLSSALASPPSSLNSMAVEKITNIRTVYQIGDLLGEGGFGQVYRATSLADGQTLALKCLPKDPNVSREIDVLYQLNHKARGHAHVLQLYNAFETDNHYWLAMELIEGGELFEHLLQHGAYSESIAARFVRQLAEALAFLHAAGVVHADLKPENLMMSSWWEEEAQLKLVDFGCSIIMGKKDDTPEKKKKEQSASTVAYDPPEKLIHGYSPTFSSDVWAAGCIVYIVLTGTHPCDKMGTSTDDEIVDRVKGIELSEHRLNELIFDERTEGLSDAAINLLQRMLHPDPTKRITAERFRRNRWVQGLDSSWKKLEGSDEKLERYWQKEFRRRIFHKFRNTLGVEGGSVNIGQLRDVFQEIDLDGNGSIDEKELSRVLLSAGATEDDIQKIHAAIDLDHNDGISFEEFKSVLTDQLPAFRGREYYQKGFKEIIAREIHTKHKEKKDDSLHAAAWRMFVSMDLDNNGVIDCHELRVLLRGLGVEENEISLLFASIDLNKDGSISFDEFKKVLFGARKRWWTLHHEEDLLYEAKDKIFA